MLGAGLYLGCSPSRKRALPPGPCFRTFPWPDRWLNPRTLFFFPVLVPCVGPRGPLLPVSGTGGRLRCTWGCGRSCVRSFGRKMAERGGCSPALLCLLVLSGTASAMLVTVKNPFNVVILFQPITLQCSYDTSSLTPPIVTWKFKSYCRDRIADAFSSSSSMDSTTNNLMQQAGYNPYVECQDSSRTVRIVATKQSNTVTLGQYYQGRKITINNNADLTFDQTAWGDSGVYYCTVFSAQDLTGNNEAYAELMVLDWLFVVLVVLAGFFLVLMIGICWCQCCPHTCCCYVRCPCCPEKCCCPRALYEAGKAATAGVPSMYAPSVYAPSMYSHQVKMPPPPGSVVKMYNGYDYDAASSVGGHSSQAPLLRDNDAPVSVRSGYRIQANQQDDSMRVLYYMEKELANFDPTRPGPQNSRFENTCAMSEVSSLHEEDHRNNLRNDLGRLRNQAMSPIQDIELESLPESGYRRPPQRPHDYNDDFYRGERRARTRSMDDLDDLERRDRYRDPTENRSRGRRSSEDDDSSRGYGRGRDARSPDPRDEYYGGKRSRSRDDLRDYDRSRQDPEYDDRFLEDALRRKQQQRAGSRDGLDSVANSSRSEGRRNNRRNDDDDDFPPPPPPYTETESVSSRGKKLKKGEALSRESLIV
ncbi:lipolysis-stimulated lipoprotein receptor isoform X2 [Dendrobates tinctorius]|uniref:lipolysis-stimulated lipoprotein receptor isoform X2 n=1 Tax=Dendrobates tinctorius TaxID=92724 RepID=UPI003CCA455A